VDLASCAPLSVVGLPGLLCLWFPTIYNHGARLNWYVELLKPDKNSRCLRRSCLLALPPPTLAIVPQNSSQPFPSSLVLCRPTIGLTNLTHHTS
jgi:hypothetical protein